MEIPKVRTSAMLGDACLAGRMWLLRRLPLRGWTDAEFHKIVVVRPSQIVDYQDISRWSHPRLTPYRPSSGLGARKFVRLNVGKVLDGEWDQIRMPFDDNEVYRLLYERFAVGRQWEEIELFQGYLRDIEAGRTVWRHSSTREELLTRASEVESLYRDIRDDGYRYSGSASSSDEVTVSIGRNGELLYNNVGGHHRLSIAKLLGVEYIPVRVLLRHRRWQDVRDRVRSAPEVDSLDDTTRSFLGHPDLRDLLQKK